MKKHSRKILVIFTSFIGLLITIILMWQVINAIHFLRKGVPIELYHFFGTRKLVDNIHRKYYLKAEGRDADYVYLFEYNQEASRIIDESQKSGKWKAFPVEPEILQRNDQYYSGLCSIKYGWAGFIDELPITKGGYDGYWTFIDRMKRKPDGSMATDGDAMLIIDDKPNRHLIFIKIVW